MSIDLLAANHNVRLNQYVDVRSWEQLKVDYAWLNAETALLFDNLFGELGRTERDLSFLSVSRPQAIEPRIVDGVMHPLVSRLSQRFSPHTEQLERRSIDVWVVSESYEEDSTIQHWMPSVKRIGGYALRADQADCTYANIVNLHRFRGALDETREYFEVAQSTDL